MDWKKVEEVFAKNRELVVKHDDVNGRRKPNVKVDIGYGNRNYYGFTNRSCQLQLVIADEIILQNESEDVLINGRYSKDEAKIPGTESPYLDQGHVIADKLGGVSNGYNITPQVSYLNRKGEYHQFEEFIYNHLLSGSKVTDFKCYIAYKNSQTQVPKSYEVTYKINGKTYLHYMKNIKKTES